MTAIDDGRIEPWHDTRQTNAIAQTERASAFRAARLPGVALEGEHAVDTLIRYIEMNEDRYALSMAACHAHGWVRAHPHQRSTVVSDGMFKHRSHVVRAVRFEPGLRNADAFADLLPESEFALSVDRYSAKITDLTGQLRDLRVNAGEWLVRLWDGRWTAYPDEEFQALYEPLTGPEEASHANDEP